MSSSLGSSPRSPLTAEVRTLHGQPSWLLRNTTVEFAVTHLGAHLADASFGLQSGRPVSPYYVSPWQEEGLALPAPVLVPLRGDFFCLPFGGNGTPYQGECHPPHGETVGSPWTLDSVVQAGLVQTMTVSLQTQVRPGRVSRELSLVEGHHAVYERTVIEGFAGPTPFAHHAILASPTQDGAMRITARPFKFGLVCPHVFSDPARCEYQALQPGAEFSDLAHVPSWRKGEPDADCSVYPARRGFADLIGTFTDPADNKEPDWVTAVNVEAGWLWFAFKDAAVMPSRVHWMENYGRHGSPWNGRNSCIGLEDGCMYFDAGLAEAVADNVVNRRGIPTARTLTNERPLEVFYVQGAVPIPAEFDRVATVRFQANQVEFVASSGSTVTTPLRASFVFDGRLPGS